MPSGPEVLIELPSEIQVAPKLDRLDGLKNLQAAPQPSMVIARLALEVAVRAMMVMTLIPMTSIVVTIFQSRHSRHEARRRKNRTKTRTSLKFLTTLLTGESSLKTMVLVSSSVFQHLRKSAHQTTAICKQPSAHFHLTPSTFQTKTAQG